MRRDPSLPGFGGEAALVASGRQYRGNAPRPVGGAVVVARVALPIYTGDVFMPARISRCGAACKCCSADGDEHTCDVCGRCSP
jgi:hypothetical protein